MPVQVCLFAVFNAMKIPNEQEHLHGLLKQLQDRKSELAAMCRLDQIAEIRERIRHIQDKLAVTSGTSLSD